MKHRSRLLALVLTLALIFSLAACARKSADSPAPETPPTEAETPAEETSSGYFRVAALKGPTSMGLVKLMQDNDAKTHAMLDSSKAYEGEVGILYNFTLAGSADEVTPALIKGELDMACVPANLAAVLYSKTAGDVQVLAVIDQQAQNAQNDTVIIDQVNSHILFSL